jgi:hypothetical protein
MPLGLFQRAFMLFVTCTMILVAVLIFAGTFAVPPRLGATTQRSVTPVPSCMRQVTVHSRPCNAMIYIDGIQLGRTPMTFPMPQGRYTLVLLAPGHERYAQRILVPDAPLNIEANLVPSR